MSLFSKIKKTLTDVFTQDDEDDKKKESKSSLASKTLTTGIQTTKAKSKANTAALKSTQNSQQVKATSAIKQPKEKGTTATKVNSSAFSGNKSTTSQNRYNNLKIKSGGGLYTESDFGNMRANSVRMSDSQKGNNNSKPTGVASIIKMANIQSKNLDNTVQNTINAYNAAAQKSTTSQSGRGSFKIKTNGGLYTEDDLNGLRANSAGVSNLQKGTSSVISGATKNALSKLSTNEKGVPTKDAKKAALKMAAKNATNDVGGVFKGIADAIASPVESVAETSKNAFNKAVKQSTHETNKPRTLASVDGKAPAGAKVGDTIVTNAGSYKITGVYSDGSFQTDSKDTWVDDQGKIWESPTKKGKKQTKSNTYDYDDPNKTEKEATFSTGEFAKNLVSNFLNDDSKKEEYETNVHALIKDAETGYNSLSTSARKNYTNKDYGLLRYVDTNDTDTDVALADTMSTEQKGIYNYLYEKKGRKAAKEYYEAIKYTELEPKQAEKLRSYASVDAESNPIVSSVASVGANTVLPAINTVRNAVQGTKNALGIGKYKPITADDNFSVISNYGSEVRQNVSKEISNPALRIGYNAVMSIADMAAQTAVAGAGGTAANAGKFVTLSMSTVSANDTILDTLSRGGSQKQAFTNGLVNGALEYISESPAVEGLFAVGRGIRPIANIKDFGKTVLRQMGVEGGGEGFANITQTLADQIIMGKKSTFGKTVSEYMSNQNMSYNDAVKQASIDLYGKGTAEAVITGALAGGVLGGGSTAVNIVSTGRNINGNTDYAKDLANTADEIGVTGSAAKTVQAIKNGERVSAVNAANLKGTVQKYYLDEATNDIDNIYEYVGLEAPDRLSLAFGKTSSKDETGFQNKKFTDAWLNKSLDILDKINQYKINGKPELKREISNYLDYSNTLLYSGVLSQEGQISAGVRAQANQIINGIAASAAGENIVSEDNDLYEEDTINTNTDTNQDTLDTDQSQDVNTIQDDSDTASVMGDIVDTKSTKQGNNQNASSDVSSNSDTVNATLDTDSDTLDTDSDIADVDSDVVELQSSDINPATTSDDNNTIDKDTTSNGTADTSIKKTVEVPANSVVKRDIDSFSVGKRAGSTITYHRSAEQTNESTNARTAAGLLADSNYDLIKESPKSNTVTFIYTRDFDTNTEPTVTKEVQVKLRVNGNATVTQLSVPEGKIIVDKSEYVPSDYTGFDVEKQKAREASWKNSGIRYNSAKLNNKQYFNDTFGDTLGTTSGVSNLEQIEAKNEPVSEKDSSLDESDALTHKETAEENNVDESVHSNTADDATEEKYEQIEWLDLDKLVEERPATTTSAEKKAAVNNMRSHSAIAREMKQAFSVLYSTPKAAKEMSKLVKEIYNDTVDEGQYNIDKASDMFDYVVSAIIETSDDPVFENLNIDEMCDIWADKLGEVLFKAKPDKKSTKAGGKASESADKEESTGRTKKSTSDKKNDGKSKSRTEKDAGGKSEKGRSESSNTINEKGTATEEKYEQIEWLDLDKLVEERPATTTSAEKKAAVNNMRSHSAIAREMKQAFSVLYSTPKAAKEMSKLVKEIYNDTVDEGQYNIDKASDMFDYVVSAIIETSDDPVFENLNIDEMCDIWADKLGEVLFKAKPDKKSTKAGGKASESADKEESTGRTKKSTSDKKNDGKSKSRTEKDAGGKSEKGRSESSNTINEKGTATEEKVGETKPAAKKKSTKKNNKSDSSEQPVELKARGGQSAAVNKDSPLRGSLYNVVPQKNYGKTDAAIDAISAENRATATSINSIVKEIGKRFRVNIYAKRYRNKGKNTLGWFDSMHSQIHTQEKEQLGVAIHELGHKIDALTGLSKTEAVKNMLNNVPDLKTELKSRGYSDNEMPFEIVADFVWKYLSEPDKAYEVGGYAGNANFYDTFEKVLKQNKLLKDVQRTRGDVLAFTTKNTTERIRGQIKTRQEAREESKVHINDLKTPNKMLGKLSDGFNSIYGNFQENFIDSTWAASQVVKQVEKASGYKLSPAENLQLALEFSGSNASITDTLITQGFITPTGEITGREAFADIIKEVEKKGKQYSGVNLNKGNRVIEDFGLYLVARHAIDRENLGQTTMSQDASGGDNVAAYKQLIKDFDKQYHNLFGTYSDIVYEWYDDFMDTWLVKTGMLEQEKYDHMKKMYPHYVPIFRVMDVRNKDRSGSRGVNPLKHNSLKGSTRQIYNPIENIMVQVNNIVSAYHYNQVGRSIHLLWNSDKQEVRESIAMFVSKVDIPLAKQTVQTEQMKASLQNKIFKDIYNNVWSASERGNYSRMTPEQQENLRNALTNKNLMDEVIDDVVTQFIPSDANLPPDTVVAIVNGKKHYYNILDEHLAMAIAAAPPSSALLQTIGKLTRVFSALTTSSNPIFAISNAIRDFQHGWVYTDAQKWYQNFTYPAEWAVSLGQAFKNEFFGKQSERYMQFKSTTGFSSKYTADSDTLGRVMAEMRHSHNPLVWVSRFVEKLNSAVESASRYVAFKRVYNATGGNITVAGKAQREAAVNFNRKGKVTRQANQAVPFLGAAIAGINQFVTLVSSKETYTTHEGRMKLARAMVTQALPSILLAFMNTGWFGDDDEKRKEYDQLSEYIKNNYWVFKFGDVWLRLPRDRELSAFFGVTFQNIVLDYIYPDERDETTMKELISFMVEQFIPTVSPVGWALVQARNNKTWYDSSIVSTSEEDYLKNPDTYTYITDESTSNVADALAKVIGKGPEQMREWLGVLATPKGIDYVLDQLTGVVGDIGLPLTTPTESWAGLGSSLVSKYTSNADKSSRYTTEAYDIMDKLTALKKAEMITDEEASWLEAFDSTMSASTKEDPDYVTVGDYYKQIRELKNDVNLSNKERTEKMNEIYTHIADMTYNLVRAYKDGGTVQNYAEKIIPEDISSVGLTAEMYTNAYKTLNTGDDTSTKFAIVANASLTEEQKQYMSQDILSSDYDNYAVSYKKLTDKGVTAEQVGAAKESVAQYTEKKAKAIAIAGSGIENAALIGTVVAGTSDDKIDTMTSYYSSAVSAGVTADMYVSVTDKALEIAQTNGKKGITKDSLASASKAAGLTSAQTYAIKHIYNSKWK